MRDVSTPSAAYEAMSERWQQMRDVVEGAHAVKAAGVTYLPPLDGHVIGTTITGEYKTFRDRTLFYGCTGRTIDGLTGMVFRRPPIVELPPAADALRADCDMMGRSIEEFSDAILREVLTTGRVAVLVDHTRQGEDFSEGEVGAGPPQVLRPYLALYATEAVLDAVYEVVGGARTLVQVRLAETMGVPGADEFETDEIKIIRVLELVGGLYRQRVFEEAVTHDDGRGNKTTTWTEREDLMTEPTLPGGGRLDKIPVWIIGTGSSAVPGSIEPPPLLDLSEVNLTHYRTDADYRNAIHMAGTPTPYCLGMSDPGEPIKFGAAQFLWFGDPNAKEVGFLSYKADGVAAIRQSLLDLEQSAAFLGARMLQRDRPGVEAAETARIYRQGEFSILARIAHMVDAGMTGAARMMCEWAGIPTMDDHRVELNDDYMPIQAAPQALAEMVKAWQAGAISHESLWHFAQEGELVDPRRTIEEERDLIAEEDVQEAAKQAEMDKQFPPPAPPQSPQPVPAAGPNGQQPSQLPQERA